MLQYPEIPGAAKAPLGKPCIAFYKYDGSNLRFEWQRKNGWFKYGTRNRLFDKYDPTFSMALPIFEGLFKLGSESLADGIVRRCKKIEPSIQRIVAFCEFFGPSSFAGKHVDGEAKELRLIDVSLYKRGFITPRDFINTFGTMPECAQVVYEGNLNQSFIDDVRKGRYPLLWEGVVAKGTTDSFMVKIKTEAYFKKLNEVYGTEYRNYWE